MHKIKARVKIGARGVAVIALAGALAWGAEMPTARAQERLSRTEMPMAPNASATDLRGKKWSLSGLRGYPVIVTMFATWCPPSREQLGELNTLQRKYGHEGLIILAVSEENPEKLKDYVFQHNLQVPLLNDSGQMMAAFGTTTYPSTFFVGRDGRVLAAFEGGSPKLTPVLAGLAQHELAPLRIEMRRARESAREETRINARRRRIAQRASTRRVAASQSVRARSNTKRTARRAKPPSGDGVLMLSNSGTYVLR